MNSGVGLVKSLIAMNYSNSNKSGFHESSSGFALNIPLIVVPISIGFSYQKHTWYVYKNEQKYLFGSLYMKDAINTDGDDVQDPVHIMDAYENPYVSASLSANQATICLPNYDSYNVNAQGISGSMSPKHFECANISLEGGDIFEDDKNLEYLLRKDPSYPTYNNFSKDASSIYFYFDYENSSYLVQENPGFSYADYEFLVEPSNLTHTIDGKTNYNSETERKGSGKYVEWYSNKQILDASGQINGLINYPVLDRTSLPEKGIGAFAITDIDGVTYHYSLPVYHYEQFSVSEKKSGYIS